MTAHHIGSAAAQITSRGGEAKVTGLTSRGVFLSIGQRVLFVSFERWRGPLTINVDKAFDCAIGEAVWLSSTRLIFPTTEVDLSAAEVCQPSAPAFARSVADQREALRQIASSVLARKSSDVIPSEARNLRASQATYPIETEIPRRRSTAPRNDTYPIENGFGLLLPHLLDLPEKQALSVSDAALLARLKQLRELIQQQDFDQATTLIESLLGLGRGLTPSGDDVTIGLLLMLNRWSVQMSLRGSILSGAERSRRRLTKQSPLDLPTFNQRVIDLAYQRTTTISANLIECAANGEADERLINVIDGLVTGTPSRDDCVECVIGWGNSSGLDALIGMVLAAA